MTGPGEGLRYSSPAGRWVIAATVAGSGLATIDGTVVGIALPSIGREFHAGVAGLQWVVTAYLLALAGLLLLGGALGDRYGRRRVFLVGVVWFALASLVCGVAPDAWTLVAARGLQGVGGALLVPGSLAILQGGFREEDRGRAIGAWSGLGGIAAAVGPFLGGYLIQAVSWRLIFLINLPLAAGVVAVGLRHVPETRDPTAPRRLDWAGGALATGGLLGITFGLIEGPVGGWATLRVLGPLAVGVGLLVAFVAAERRSRHPLLPVEIFRSRQFNAANLLTFVVYGALGGALFLLPVALQDVARYSPIEAGASLLPVTVIMLLLSPRSGALAGRIGPRLQMTAGPVLVAAGLALLVRVDSTGSYLDEVLPAMVVFGLGLAVCVAPLTTTVLAAASADHAGVASAVNNDVARAAGLIAVAVLPAAAGISGSGYLEPIRLAAGFHRAVLLCAGLCLAGAVVAGVGIRSPTRTEVGDGRENAHSCPLDAPPLRS